jgi:DHA1 family bicyclomycin/chloramphenicol resistance-like MFS transporter
MKIIAKIHPATLFCLFALSNLTESVSTSALPSISSFFYIQDNIAQLLSSSYFCGFALGILTLGRISDLYGRRPVVLFGMILYLFSSLLGIFANNIEVLILARLIQGFGGSI